MKKLGILLATLLALQPLAAEAVLRGVASGPAGAITALPVPVAQGGTASTSLGNCLTNSGGILNWTQPINPQTGTTYTILSGDGCKEITASNTAIQAYTLPQAGTAGFTSGYSFSIQNIGTAPLFIVPTTSTINGAAFLEVAPGQGQLITANVSNNYDVGSGNAVMPAPAYTGAAANMVPVCNAVYNQTNTSGTGQQIATRVTYYCPNGATSLSLIYTSFGMVSLTTETDNTFPIPINASVYVSPAPWNASTAYVSGNTVLYNPTESVANASYTNNPIWAWAANSTNSPPTPSNTNWTFGATPTPIPVTCSGRRPCIMGTNPTASSALVADGILVTDPANISVPAGGFITVLTYVFQTGSQMIYVNNPAFFGTGAYYKQAASNTDVTLTGANSYFTSLASVFSPSAIIGIPAVNPNAPTAVIIGDSRPTGIQGSGLSSFTATNNGANCTSADEGVVCKIPDTGASSNEVCRSGQIICTKVAAGACTQVRVFDTGCYAGTNNGQTLPSTGAGGQTIATCGNCTGIIGTAAFNSSGLDMGDANFSRGYWGRILSNSGIAYTGVVASGDTIAGWISRDYSRLAFIQATHARNAIIEFPINDIRAGTSKATIEANITTLAKALLGNGYVKAVFLGTVPPDATSTDGYLGTANQTAEAHDAVRTGLNDDCRNGAITAITGCFETADPTESARNSGKWAATGTACNSGNTGAVNVYTCDGLHENTVAETATVTAVGNISQKLY